MASNVTVKVSQTSGEIRVSYNGAEPVTYQVHNGETQVPERDLDKFLDAVEGSTRAAKPADSKAKEGDH